MPTSFSQDGKRRVQAPGTVTDLTKSIYYIQTARAFYEANNMTVVMNLWKDSKDSSEVLDVGRLG